MIKLNVGGKLFVTSKTTLAFDKNSVLWLMIQDDGEAWVESAKDENGYFFIDRDPTYFHIILNFLRNGKLVIDKDPLIVAQLILEAEYYNIQGLLEILSNIDEAEDDQESVITINVGGTFFKTTKETLLKAGPDSILCRMLTEKGLVKRTCGAYFIDRDPKYFAVILNVLRNNHIFAGDYKQYPSVMFLEAKFYGIDWLSIIFSDHIDGCSNNSTLFARPKNTGSTGSCYYSYNYHEWHGLLDK